MVEHSGSDLNELVRLSAQLGRNSLLVQGSTGNTSIKLGGTLWIKASGKWLCRATEESVFVPVPLRHIENFLTCSLTQVTNAEGTTLRPSIETAMHLVLPHRVVVHIHSVNVISWALRQDGYAEVARRLNGMAWRWIPYALSGAPLANALRSAQPVLADIFILANHGLVIGAATCAEALALVAELERRLYVPPRKAPEPDLPTLDCISRRTGYRFPVFTACHSLVTDLQSWNTIRRGILYPCQAVYFGTEFRLIAVQDAVAYKSTLEESAASNLLLFVEGCGLLVSEDLKSGAEEILLGLAEVVRRLPPRVPISYLNASQIEELLDGTVYPDYQKPRLDKAKPGAANVGPLATAPAPGIPDSR